jgi:hypothetical protein
MYLRMVPDLEVEGGARNLRLGGGGRDIVSHSSG